MTPDDLAEHRKWVRLHENNRFQAEAARRITALLAEVERLRDDRDRWKQAYEMADPLLTDRDRLAATVDRVRALIEDIRATRPVFVTTFSEDGTSVRRTVHYVEVERLRAAIEGTDS